MRRSEDRNLTTRTGSLPQPPEPIRLYVPGRGASRSIRSSSGSSVRIASERLQR